MAILKLEQQDIVEVATWLDGFPATIEEIESLLPTSGPPRTVTVRMLLTGLIIATRYTRTSHLREACKHLNQLSRQERTTLGLDSYDKVTERTFGLTWKHVTQLIDEHHTDTADRPEAARLCEELIHQIITASVPPEVQNHQHLAIDTTITESWAAPPSPFKKTTKRKRVEQVRKDKADDIAATDKKTTEELEEKTVKEWSEARGRRLTGYTEADYEEYEDFDDKAARPVDEVISQGPYDCVSAAWIGNKNPRKVAYGHAVHIMTAMPATGQDPDSLPLVALSLRTTRSTANPVATMLSMAKALYRRRQASGETQPLGDIAGDGAFFPTSQAALEMKALGAMPIFHMHATNQQGLKRRDEHVVWIDGRPYCKCIPERLRVLRYPRLPHEHRERAAHRRQLAKREPFAYTTHGTARADGSRRWASPHTKKRACLHCDNDPVRCCQRTTRLFSPEDLALVQPEVFGDEKWALSYARRALVEGYFGVLQSFSGLRNDNVRFHQHGKIALAHALLVAATNLHLVATWRKRVQRIKDNPDEPTRRERRKRNRNEKQSATDAVIDDHDGTTDNENRTGTSKRSSALGFLDE